MMNECTKLNRCLEELDTLIVTSFGPDTRQLTLVFGSPGGGCYEDVKLTMDLEDAISFHLPAYFEGPFKVHICDEAEGKVLVPELLYEPTATVMRFNLTDAVTPFYVQCMKVRWKLNDAGFVKNEEELISPNEIEPKETDPATMAIIENFSEILITSLTKALNESGLTEKMETKKIDESKS